MSIVSSKLRNCPSCGRWVCSSCWDESKGTCKACSNSYSGSPATEPLFTQPEPEPVSAPQDSTPPEPTTLPLNSPQAQGGFTPPIPINIPTIICPYCGKPTIPGPRCGNCGKPLLVKCPNCGEMVPAQKHCMKCGAPLNVF